MDKLKDAVDTLLDSENDLVRRTTMVVALPIVVVGAVVLDAVEHAAEWATDIVGELPGLRRELKAIWDKPRK